MISIVSQLDLQDAIKGWCSFRTSDENFLISQVLFFPSRTDNSVCSSLAWRSILSFCFDILIGFRLFQMKGKGSKHIKNDDNIKIGVFCLNPMDWIFACSKRFISLISHHFLPVHSQIPWIP